MSQTIPGTPDPDELLGRIDQPDEIFGDAGGDSIDGRGAGSGALAHAPLAHSARAHATAHPALAHHHRGHAAEGGHRGPVAIGFRGGQNLGDLLGLGPE